jgi:outer membrane protein TolC
MRRKNSLQSWAAILLGLAVTPALLTAQVSLSTVVDLAQRNSSAVKLAEADVQKATASLAQAKDAYIPSLTLNSGLPAFPVVGFNGGVPSIWGANTQSLVFSVPQKLYIQAGTAGLKAAALRLKDVREQVALDASTAYIELDTINSELDSAHQQEGYAGRLVEIEQQRSEAGIDPLSDLLQAQLTAAQLKLKRLHLETRAGVLARQLVVLTGLPAGSITPDHASIPAIPEVKANERNRTIAGIESAQLIATAKQQTAKGDSLSIYLPQLSFGAQYSHHTSIENNAAQYYRSGIPVTYFGSGFSIQLPLFDWGQRDKAKESAADALRSKVEAEQAQRQNDVQISDLTGSLRELDTLAEIASLKQQIASEQLHAVLSQLELGNGATTGPGATAQITPRAEQLARIDEREKFQESLDAGLELSKARLNLLRALGHMQDWLNELHGK